MTTETNATKLQNVFYCYNHPARSAMLFIHDRVTGLCLLSLAYATNKKDKVTGKVDVFNKATVRAILQARITGYLMDGATSGKGQPFQAHHQNVFSLGYYDGQKSKNDIFGPLVDLFQAMPARRNVDNENLLMHVEGLKLVTMANHKLAKEWRADKKKKEAENKDKIDALMKELKEQIKKLPLPPLKSNSALLSLNSIKLPLLLEDKNMVLNVNKATV